MHRKFSSAAVLGAAIVCQAVGFVAETARGEAPERAALEREFERALSGVVFRGYYTTAGREQKQGLKEEKYTIAGVRKLEGDKWLFQVRIQYGEHDVSLPLALDVLWAGDTPVITLTDLPVPGLGTFTARVAVYRGQYAGTWDGGAEPDGGRHGGHLFGRIEPLKNSTEKQP